MEKKPWENPGSVGASSPLTNRGTVCDSDSITSHIGSEHLEYLSISICLEEEVITPVCISVDVCRVDEAFTGLMRLALQDELGWVQAQVHHRGRLL